MVREEVFAPLLFGKPKLVRRALVPIGNVALSQTLGIGAEVGNDILLFTTIAEHKIDASTYGFWQAGQSGAGLSVLFEGRRLAVVR